FIRPDLRGTLQQHVNRVIKIPLGRFQVSRFELVLSRLIFLVGVRDQIGDRIRFGLRYRWNGFGRGWFWIRFFLRRSWGRWSRGSHRRSIGLGYGQLRLALGGMAGRARYKQCGQRRGEQREPLNPHVYL